MDGLKESRMVTWPTPKTFAGYISLLDLVSRSCSPQCQGLEQRGAKLTNPSFVLISVISCTETHPGLRAPAHGAELSQPHLLA